MTVLACFVILLDCCPFSTLSNASAAAIAKVKYSSLEIGRKVKNAMPILMFSLRQDLFHALSQALSVNVFLSL